MLGSYIAKQDSAKGRIIIWRCTWEMIKDKPWFGHGYKSFEAKYMLYQADYFERNPESYFIFLSDNVKHPFNEFLLLIVEFGLFIFLLFVLFAIKLIMIYRKDRTDELFLMMLALLAIAIFSSFSYPFQYPYTWFIFSTSALSASFINNESKYKIHWFSKLLIFISFIFLFCITVKEIYYENKWHIAANQRGFGNTQEAVSAYKSLYPHLKQNTCFLYNYAAKLNYFGYYKESSLFAAKCENYLNDYDIQMLLADIFFHLKKWNEAKNHYYKALYMCPNRFIPLNQLHKIAVFKNDNKEARRIASLIIDKPIKISSATIHQMKNKMQQYLDGEINCIRK